MNHTNRLTSVFTGAGMLLLILDSKTALAGAQTGIVLCIQTVIPSLYPFFVLSVFFNSTLSGSSLRFLKPLACFCRIPEGSEFLLISGFLGGYPVGAQSIASAFRTGMLKKDEADRLLSFCSNAGPAFLFGMVSPMFSDPSVPFLLWAIHVLSAVLVARLVPAVPSHRAKQTARQIISLSEGIKTAASAMVNVCSWVVLFRILLSFLERWILWYFPIELQVILTGFLELSNGCVALCHIKAPSFRFLVCSGMLAWGGICVCLQTCSVANGLSFPSYLKGKLLQTLFSLIISAAIALNFWLPTVFLLCFFLIWTQKRKKEVEIPCMLVYN